MCSAVLSPLSALPSEAQENFLWIHIRVSSAYTGGSHGGRLMPNNDGNQPATTRAVRLIFEYDGDQVRLISQHAVDMVMTGFDSAQAAQHAGVYVDSRDKEGMTLARVPARNAFATSEEVFPERMD